jgi:hypothetical protein
MSLGPRRATTRESPRPRRATTRVPQASTEATTRVPQASTGHHEFQATSRVPQVSTGHHESPPGLDGPPREWHLGPAFVVGTSQACRPVIASVGLWAPLAPFRSSQAAWSSWASLGPLFRSSQAAGRRGGTSRLPGRSSQAPGRHRHLWPSLPVIAGAWSSRTSLAPPGRRRHPNAGHHRRLVAGICHARQVVVGTSRASLSVTAGEPSHLGLSRFPFPVLSRFPGPTLFVPNARHLPCRQVKLVRTGYTCLAPIVKHHKDEHNMENGKNAKANMWSPRS